MSEQLSQSILESIFNSKENQRTKILKDIQNIIVKSNCLLEGNSFYTHHTLNIFPDLYTKQLNLLWCGLFANKSICEIGFNAGHSTMLMLLGRDDSPVNFTIFDIGVHAYMRPCLYYIKKEFPNVTFEYIHGDSTVTIPEWIIYNRNNEQTYDVVHVDGGHSDYCIRNDMMNSDKLLRVGGLLIINDTNVQHINNCVNRYISYGRYAEVNILQTYGHPHRILKKLKNNVIKCLYFYNENQRVLKNVFERSLIYCMPCIELVPLEFVYKASTSDFGTYDFRELMLEKVQRVRDYIHENIGTIVLISDIDIVVHDNFEHMLEIDDNVDIILQKECRHGGLNTGFILLKCSEKTYTLWNDIEASMAQVKPNAFINEQAVLNQIIGNYNVNYRVFDDSIWAFSNFPKPNKIYIHHANCTGATSNKSSLQLKCEQLIQNLEDSALPIKDELISMLIT